MIKNNLKKFVFNFLIVLSIFLIDRLSKIYIINLAKLETILDIYITPYLNFYLIWNQGISFGLFPFEDSLSYGIVSIIISIAIVIIIIMAVKENSKFKKYSLLLILGGALGNLYDRIRFSAVPDFIDIHILNFHWFIFNVADIFISVGVICLIYAEIFFKKKNEKF